MQSRRLNDVKEFSRSGKERWILFLPMKMRVKNKKQSRGPGDLVWRYRPTEMRAAGL